MRLYKAFLVGLVKLIFFFFLMDEILGEGSLVCKNGLSTPVLWGGGELNQRDCSYDNSKIFSSYIYLSTSVLCHAACCKRYVESSK